jgi:hypothetical protein
MGAMQRRGKVIPFPTGRRAAPAAPRDGLVEVRRCGDQAEAVVVRSLLESHGIRSALRGKLVHSVHPFAVGDLAEVVVLVAAGEAERARRVLSWPVRNATGNREEA